jgi:CubicO group peptidase (beta-lactamase class C family)
VADNLFLRADYREKEIYKAIKKSPLQDEKAYVYSGLSFYLYPEIIEQYTGSEYEQYLKENFYQPLGAFSLTYNPLRFYPKDRIVPTENDDFFRMQQLHGTVHDEGAAMMQGVSGNAGLFSTINDLAKLMQMYLEGGKYGGKRYIDEEMLKFYTSCAFCYNGNRRGLGFDKPVLENKHEGSTAWDASSQSYGHSGYTGTFTWVDPENELLFIFFSNRVYPTRENRKLYQLSIRPGIHQVLYDALRNGPMAN